VTPSSPASGGYHRSKLLPEVSRQFGGDQLFTQNKYNLWPGTQDRQLQFMVDLINTVKHAGGTGVFYWVPEGSRGNGMWNAGGTPAVYSDGSFTPAVAKSIAVFCAERLGAVVLPGRSCSAGLRRDVSVVNLGAAPGQRGGGDGEGPIDAPDVP
jgi:hypothetical protein